MDFSWSIFIDFGIISLALLLATILRAVVPFFQRFRIPNAVTAGFLLLFFYNYAAPFFGLKTGNLGSLAFHFLGISFAAMSLRKQPERKNRNEVFPVTVVLLMQHILQAVIGLALTFVFIKTIRPDLFPGFGLLFPLGFALGPGQALAFSSKWSRLGFAGAESVGLTFAALGFLFACFGGIALINIGLKKGLIKPEPVAGADSIKKGLIRDEQARPSGMKLVSHSETIDTVSLNSAIVLAVYFVTFLLLKGGGRLLNLTGSIGKQFGDSLWAITFVFAGLAAQLVKKIMKILKVDFILENGALNRISGFSVDYLVAASLGLISLAVVHDYWLEIATITVVGSTVVIFLQLWVSSRVFSEYGFYRMITVYGAMTGTIATGLTLLRVLDPEFKTPTASDHMYAAGLTFPLAIPFILMADFPANYYTTGKPFWLFLTAVVLGLYVVFISLMIIVLGRKKSGF